MYKINIIAVGNLKDKEFISLEKEYIKRLSRFAKVEIIELKEKTNLNNIDLIKNSESEDIKTKANLQNSILFDVKGKSYSSEDFAKFIENLFNTQSEITFIIGGSYGVNDEIKNTVKNKVSLSNMTFPHRLFRVMALEQIYRAFTILNNITYHK